MEPLIVLELGLAIRTGFEYKLAVETGLVLDPIRCIIAPTSITTHGRGVFSVVAAYSVVSADAKNLITQK